MNRVIVVAVIVIVLSGALSAQAQNTVTFDNQSGEPAFVKLIGQFSKEVEVPNGTKQSVEASAGRYTVKVRYGTPGKYRYSKGEVFEVKETSRDSSSITITLHKVVSDNYGSREISEAEFGKAAGPAESQRQPLPAAPAATPPSPGKPWTNSLGMKFVPLPRTAVLFCIWETRVQDFDAFVKSTGHDATSGMRSMRRDGYKERGDTWKSPGFSQGPTHPVVGVSWEDAKAFCQWLTAKECREGHLNPGQSYRLPTDVEWSRTLWLTDEEGSTPREKDAKISGLYPWGTEWPPPSGAGNFAGDEAKNSDWHEGVPVIVGYNDGHPRTAPVGSFKPNQFGVYDLSGNVWEWCEDWYDSEQKGRVLRGGSWIRFNPRSLLSSDRINFPSNHRSANFGFRVVLVAGDSSR